MNANKLFCPACGIILTTTKTLMPETRVQCPNCGTSFAVSSPGPKPATNPTATPAPPLVEADAFRFDDQTAPPKPITPQRTVRPVRRPSKGQRQPLLLWSLAGGGAALAIALVLAWGMPGESPDKRRPSESATGQGKKKSESAKGGSAAVTDGPVIKEEPVAAAPDKRAPSPPARDGLRAAPPAAVQRAANFDDWLQDLDEAKQLALKDKKRTKDILILFDGSDWCPLSRRLAEQVWFQTEFRKLADPDFVFVHVDFPRDAPAKGKVQDSARNQRLQRQFHVHVDKEEVDGYPTIVLADAEGRPYAFTRYQAGGAGEIVVLIDDWNLYYAFTRHQAGGAGPYWTHLVELQEIRDDRDRLLQAVTREKGPGQLWAARDALAFLKTRKLTPYYLRLLKDWVLLAGKHDPKNLDGKVEPFFEAFFEQASRCALEQTDENKPSELLGLAYQLEEWKKEYRFQDGNRAAWLHWLAGVVLSQAGKHEGARKAFKDGLAYNPSNPKVGLENRFEDHQRSHLYDTIFDRRNLADKLGLAADGKMVLRTGTAFVVAAGGYLLTNHHVIKGPGRVMVQVREGQDPIAAEVVGQDTERDMALLRLKAPGDPLQLAAEKPLQRGEEVGTVGYPQELTQTHGAVAAVATEASDNLVKLDLKVNPGNSGGPLLDLAGNVVGMVIAKTRSSQTQQIESYGLALPALEIRDFIQKHLKSAYKATPPGNKKSNWQEVDKQVSPSVYKVLKVL